MSDDVCDFWGERPLLGQDETCLTMREAQHLDFGKVKRDLLACSECRRSRKFRGNDERVDEKANVVQESGNVGLLLVGTWQLFTEFTAYHGATKRMFPESGGIDS